MPVMVMVPFPDGTLQPMMVYMLPSQILAASPVITSATGGSTAAASAALPVETTHTPQSTAAATATPVAKPTSPRDSAAAVAKPATTTTTPTSRTGSHRFRITAS